MEFRVLEVPEAAPGVCRACGGSSKDWYLDTGHSEEFYGAVYYCCDCIGHIATICGFLTPAAMDRLLSEIDTLRVELFAEKVRNAGLLEVRNGLQKLGIELDADGDLHARWSGAVVDGSGNEVVPPFAPAGAEVLSKAGDGVEGGAGEAPEPVDDEGLAELHATPVESDAGDGVTV